MIDILLLVGAVTKTCGVGLRSNRVRCRTIKGSETDHVMTRYLLYRSILLGLNDEDYPNNIRGDTVVIL